ncbi:MAG TPA: methyltransferase domain-containing protein [Acidobacteriota bacterium]|nr:methyltransferase domain-containing protein [Acidobacteriota bacterium]
MDKKKRDEATARVRDFYDGPADTIYRTTWGENLHLGVPRQAGCFGRDATEHATELMARHAPLHEGACVLDLGSGYGGPARFLASEFGCPVTGLNVSTVEIEEATRQTEARGLQGLVSFDHGDFHELPYAAGSFDVVWSQDSLMYGADKRRILEEVSRVLKPGGVLDFTDILAPRDLETRDRDRLYERVRTPEMWDTERYLAELLPLGFKIRRVEDWSEHVSASYAWVREQAIATREELEAKVGGELVERTLDGLGFWVEMAERGNVGWAFIVAQMPE